MNALRTLLSFFTVLTFGLGCGADPAPRESPVQPGTPREDALSAPPALPSSKLAASLAGSSSQVYYVDPTNAVSQLASQPTEWKYSRLPATAILGSALTGLQLANGAPRVYFVGEEGRVHELWWDGTWHDHALVTQHGAPPLVMPGTSLVGIVRAGLYPRVYYVAFNRHVQELSWDGVNWSVFDVTERASAPEVAFSSPLTAFSVNGGEARVYFVATSRNVHEMWETRGGAWAQQNLTLGTNAPPASPETAMTGFATGDAWPHVYYVSGYDGQVIELKFTSQGWKYTKVTPREGPYATARATALTSFAVNPGNPRVYFVMNSNDVGELWWDGTNWHLNNLSAAVGAAGAKADSPLAGFAIDGVYSRVYYLAGNDNVMQLAWSGSNWGITNLTATAN